MNEITDIIISGKACPETKAKYKIAENYVQKQKKANKAIAIISIISLFIYILCQLYIHCFPQYEVLKYIIIAINCILIFLLFINLSFFFSSYFKYIR